MAVEVKEVVSKKEMNAFVNFPYQLYKGNAFNVPKLSFDEHATLNAKKNPAFSYCEARYWLAYKDGRVVGRIAGILNHSYIKKWKNAYMRFGWIDFEEDTAIAKALLDQVMQWAKEKGMTAIHGPMGFTDLDLEGMLVEGFDQLGTLATIYNYPYYPRILEELGFKKEADWMEYRIQVPAVIPERIGRAAQVVLERLGCTVLKAKKPKEILPYAPQIFALINEAYAHLHGVVELSESQIKYYTKQYFSFIRTDFVTLITDKQDKLVAFGITMPSLSIALQKAKGSLFPFGFIHILRALKKNTVGDMYLVAVKPELQNKGLTAVLINEIAKSYIRNGIQFAESNPELETNQQVQSFWKYFDAKNHKRRRCYIKQLST
jgi:hypothetical protein